MASYTHTPETMPRVAAATCAAVVCAVLCALLPSVAQADELSVGPTATLGVFFEFGDEVAFAGGFALWVGASIYPSVEPERDDTAWFIAPGLELRTGLIPFLSGPNQLGPQVRAGVVVLKDPAEVADGERLDIVAARLHVSAGYRWASSFGWDNMEGHRKDEHALRLGVGGYAPALWDLTEQTPVPNGLDGALDVNFDGSVDRWGVAVGLGL